MGKGMEYAETLTDQMAKTASIGMTDIDTLGESMMRLGSASGTFFSSSEEILAILSAMSQFGHDQRGAQAGTDEGPGWRLVEYREHAFGIGCCEDGHEGGEKNVMAPTLVTIKPVTG